jgi:hypothetical protein
LALTTKNAISVQVNSIICEKIIFPVLIINVLNKGSKKQILIVADLKSAVSMDYQGFQRTQTKNNATLVTDNYYLLFRLLFRSEANPRLVFLFCKLSIRFQKEIMHHVNNKYDNYSFCPAHQSNCILKKHY